MIAADPWKFDPQRDLVFERVADVPPELVWEAWTTPEHLKAWFCPKPWGVSECEIDLRPGGMFRTVMLSPEGEKFPNLGCYLDVVPNRRLIWTDALHTGFRPSNTPSAGCPVPGFFTVIISLEPAGSGTRYHALVLHRDEAGRKQHEEMGFHEGWSVAFDQLVAHCKAMQG